MFSVGLLFHSLFLIYHSPGFSDMKYEWNKLAARLLFIHICCSCLFDAPVSFRPIHPR
jgi:hypothetical protein